MNRLLNYRWYNGWSYDTPAFAHQYDGQPALSFRVVDFWVDEGGEETFKAKAGRKTVSVDGEPKRYTTLWITFQDELKEAGMMGMEEVHVDFQKLYAPWDAEYYE
jgi:hypothetical protein